MVSIKQQIIDAMRKKILFTPHCVDQMNMPSRMISVIEIKAAIESASVIEDYPEDKRGHSCLMRGITSLGRVLHVVCAPKDEYLAVITAYVPDTKIWDSTLTKRMR